MKDTFTLKELARINSPAALNILRRIMNSDNVPIKYRLQAAELIRKHLDRDND